MMTYEQAVKEMRAGRSVKRKEWNHSLIVKDDDIYVKHSDDTLTLFFMTAMDRFADDWEIVYTG